MPRRSSPSTAKTSAKAADEPCGSGQSRESFDRDKAAQPGLLAAAAARKAGGARAKAIDKKKNAVFDLSKIGSSSSPSARLAKAKFELMKAIYQKGNQAGEFSGNILGKAIGRYGQNNAIKQIIAKHAKGQYAKWNDSEKVYTFKVKTLIIAQRILADMRDLGKNLEVDLPEAIDETVFDGANIPELSIFPFNGGVGIHGDSYDLRADFKEAGFEYDHESKIYFNGNITIDDHAVDDLDDELSDIGWVVNVFSESVLGA